DLARAAPAAADLDRNLGVGHARDHDRAAQARPDGAVARAGDDRDQVAGPQHVAHGPAPGAARSRQKRLPQFVSHGLSPTPQPGHARGGSRQSRGGLGVAVSAGLLSSGTAGTVSTSAQAPATASRPSASPPAVAAPFSAPGRT